MQDITLQNVDLPTINNVVEFGERGVLRVRRRHAPWSLIACNDWSPQSAVRASAGSHYWLQVEAEANTDSRPLPGFVPRKGAGLPLFGKSSTYPPPGPVRACKYHCSIMLLVRRSMQ